MEESNDGFIMSRHLYCQLSHQQDAFLASGLPRGKMTVVKLIFVLISDYEPFFMGTVQTWQ